MLTELMNQMELYIPMRGANTKNYFSTVAFNYS